MTLKDKRSSSTKTFMAWFHQIGSPLEILARGRSGELTRALISSAVSCRAVFFCVWCVENINFISGVLSRSFVLRYVCYSPNGRTGRGQLPLFPLGMMSHSDRGDA